MTWEEYENSDWYREAHPERFEKRSREDLIEDEMRRYLGCMDEYRARIAKQKKEFSDENDDYPECLDNDILIEERLRMVVLSDMLQRKSTMVEYAAFLQAALTKNACWQCTTITLPALILNGIGQA